MSCWPRIAVALSWILLLGPAEAGAILIIDDFETGDFSVSDDLTASGPMLGEQSGLPASSVIGGVRLVRATAIDGLTNTATASLTTTPAPDGAVLNDTGVPDLQAPGAPAPLGNFNFVYDGVANGAIDATTGALNVDLSPYPAIEVDILGLAAAATVNIRLSSSTTTQASSAVPFALGTISFALGDFTLDLSDIKAIRLDLLGVAPLDTAIVSEIRAVPEPGTALLLAGGLIGLGTHRRRGRR